MNPKINLLTLLAVILSFSIIKADVSLPSFFSDNMVLQADEPIPIWGTATPGEKINVTLGKITIPTQADTEGNWKLIFPPLIADTKTEMIIEGKNKLVLKNVILGDVWFLSGQSNMEMELKDCTNLQLALADANYPSIRFFRNAHNLAAEPINNANGSWQTLSPQTAPSLSGVGFYFSRDIFKKTKRPVGLIISAWGGTPAEAWTPKEGLQSKGFTAMLNLAEKQKNANLISLESLSKQAELLEKTKDLEDPVDTPEQQTWALPKTPVKKWKTMSLPQQWEKAGLQIDGVVWFRKEIKLPKNWARKELVLELGAIDDFDTTYFNGIQVGAVGPAVKNWWIHPRKYIIPANLVKAGKNVIAVRVFDNYLGGGFIGEVQEMKISLLDKTGNPISLAGTWAYQVAYGEDRSMFMQNIQHTPTALYNGMVAPFIKTPIKGVLWYQGESNADRAWQYRTLFPTMIESWRKAWNRDFYFYFVQLANFMQQKNETGESVWAELRDAQASALKLPKTGMATAIDIGDANDIHPKNKKTLGERLAKIAGKEIFNIPGEAYGPTYKSSAIETIAIRISFNNAKDLKTTDGQHPTGFAIAGADGIFKWANAKIDGESVIVWNDKIKSPVAVRYLWADNPKCNLVNGAGLPAFPFRTDTFKLTTEGKE